MLPASVGPKDKTSPNAFDRGRKRDKSLRLLQGHPFKSINTEEDDDDDNNILEPTSLTQLSSSQSSFSISSMPSFDSSDSDTSCCRNRCSSVSKHSRRQNQRPAQTKTAGKRTAASKASTNEKRATTTAATTEEEEEQEEDDDADCNSITAGSLINLFWGPGGPCSLHLEGEEGVQVLHNTLQNSGISHKKRQPLLDVTSTRAGTVKSPALDSRPDRNITSNDQHPQRRVQFGKVKVRQYELSISENPCVSEGPPIELGWEYTESPEELSVDQFEAIRLPRRHRRLQDFLLSERERRRMLLYRGGYTNEDIKYCIRQVEHIKRQRILTYLMLPASALDEAAEDMYKYVTHFIK